MSKTVLVELYPSDFTVNFTREDTPPLATFLAHEETLMEEITVKARTVSEKHPDVGPLVAFLPVIH